MTLLDSIGAGARQVGRAAIDLLLPPTCLTCDEPVDVTGRLCAACFSATAFITEPCCHRCGVPFLYVEDGGLARACATCTANPPPGSARAPPCATTRSRAALSCRSNTMTAPTLRRRSHR